MKRISIILFVLLSLSVSAQKRGDITIALLTDLHVTPETTNDTKADEMIDEINRSDFDLVVVAGDITNTGSNAELRNIRRKLGRIRHRCIATAGNHETTWSESADTEFRRLWGHNGCTTAKAGDYLFVAYPAGPYMKMADGGIRTETLTWVDREMSKANGRKIVSVCHYPLNNDLTNREEIVSIVRRHNAIASLCGHYHKPRLMNFDSIPGILGRSLSLGKKGEENFGYTVIRFANDSIYVSEKRLGEPATAQYAVRQGYSDELAAIKCDPKPAPIDFGGIKAELIVEDEGSIYTNVIVEGDTIYYGNSEGKVKAYDFKAKRTLWERRFRDPIYSSPILHDGKIIVATVSDNLCALDAASGKTVWRNRDCNMMIGDGVIADGALYIGTNGKMFRIDPDSGRTVWQFDFGCGQPQGRPTVEGNRLVFGAWNRHLYCVDTNSGKELWRWNNGNDNVLFSPGHIVPRIANGRVMIVAPDRHMTFLALETGKEIWRIKQRRVRETTGLSADGRLFLAKTMDGEMIAVPVDADGYTEKWCTDAGWGYDHNFCPIITSNGIAYMANRTGMVAEIDESDGSVLNVAKLGNSSANDFFADDRGCIWTTLIEGKIYRIKNIHLNF